MKQRKAIRIVVVDDNEVIADMVAEYLRREEFMKGDTAAGGNRIIEEMTSEHPKQEKLTVTAFYDPEKALEHIGKNGADIVISDFVMSEMNGVEFLSRVENFCQGIRGIIMSAEPGKMSDMYIKWPIIEKNSGFLKTVANKIGEYLQV